jgi:hypothetical protein
MLRIWNLGFGILCLLTLDPGWMVFGYRYNQLPCLIEYTPQWLPGPSPLLPVTAGSPADYRTGFKLCSDALQLLFNYWHGLT